MGEILMAIVLGGCGMVLLAVALGLIPERLASAIRQHEGE